MTDWIRPFVMPVQTLIVRSVQICNFVVIKYRMDITALDIPLMVGYSVIFGTGWLGIMGMAGSFTKSSRRVLRSFKNIGPISSVV